MLGSILALMWDNRRNILNSRRVIVSIALALLVGVVTESVLLLGYVIAGARCCWQSACCCDERFAVLRVRECAGRGPDGKASMIGRRHEDIPRKSLTDAVSLPYGSRCVFVRARRV